MSDKDAATPRVFLVRHGETTWSRSGNYTGITDLPLLPEGEARITSTARTTFGPNKLISPGKVAHIYVSPRQRAQRTLELFFETAGYQSSAENQWAGISTAIPSLKIETTNDIAEWGYGEYEGKLTSEIRELRKSQGRDAERPWNIWVDGCEGPGGEKSAEVAARLDRIISSIKKMQGHGMEEKRTCDVMVVAHGHILRAFVKRWLGLGLEVELGMMLEPGGVCGLSYQHGNLEEPAVLVGMSFPGA